MASNENDWQEVPIDDGWQEIPLKPAEENPSLLRQAGSALMTGMEFLDRYTGAPVRAGINAAVDQDPSTTILGQAASQFGEDTALAPTGKDIAAKLGLSRKEDIPVFPRALVPKAVEDALGMKPGEDYVKASPAGIAGLGVEMLTDPLTYVSFGAPKAIKETGKALVKGGEKVADVAADVGKVAKGAKTEAAAAMKAAKTLEGTGAGAVEKLWAGVKGGIQGAKGTAEAAAEISDLGKQARSYLIRRLDEMPKEMRVTAIGAGKTFEALDDEEAIITALMMPGVNPIKKHMAEKAATLYPGQITADEYLKVLEMPADERMLAKEFLPREAAEQIKPQLQEAQNLFKQTRGEQFGRLKAEAGQAFDPKAGDKVIGTLADAMSDAERLKGIPGSVKTDLEAIDDIIFKGISSKKAGLIEAPLSEVDSAEYFNRLHIARRRIDAKIKWTKKEGFNEAQELLEGVRDSLDEAIKSAPGMKQADEMYRASKNLEKKFFGALEMGKNGEVALDVPKIEKMLGDTGQGYRLKEALTEFREFAQRPELSPEFKAQAEKVVDQLNEAISTMEQKQQLSKFRFKEGPTSPAVERMGAVVGKESPLTSAITSPAGFVNQQEQILKAISGKIGRPVKEFTDADRSGIARFSVWQSKNPKATMQQTEQQLEAIFPEIKAKKARDAFTGQ